MLTRSDYQDGIDIQDACNMGGLANHFAKTVQAVWQEAHEKGEGTDYVNQHPLIQIIADKIVDLSRVRSTGDFIDAMNEVERRIAAFDETLHVAPQGAGG